MVCDFYTGALPHEVITGLPCVTERKMHIGLQLRAVEDSVRESPTKKHSLVSSTTCISSMVSSVKSVPLQEEVGSSYGKPSTALRIALPSMHPVSLHLQLAQHYVVEIKRFLEEQKEWENIKVIGEVLNDGKLLTGWSSDGRPLQSIELDPRLTSSYALRRGKFSEQAEAIEWYRGDSLKFGKINKSAAVLEDNTRLLPKTNGMWHMCLTCKLLKKALVRQSLSGPHISGLLDTPNRQTVCSTRGVTNTFS
ncbi:hypothetical protein cyc_08220 [Cyclospora cayetanensis]|uniref:Uncharacterized protein n=1 Tax=Cyclospora cayetanensis TaxID=88456 RepID=A0A1D3DAV1_9EIME|nr:hypothetical protein cyc_08220 [Cyclospora cayetanensis]